MKLEVDCDQCFQPKWLFRSGEASRYFMNFYDADNDRERLQDFMAKFWI